MPAPSSLDAPRANRRAGPRADPRRGARQPARPARAAASMDAGRVRRRVRAAGWRVGLRPRSRRAFGGASARSRTTAERLLLVAAAEPVGDPAFVRRGRSAAWYRARARPSPAVDVGPARDRDRGFGSGIRLSARWSTAKRRPPSADVVHAALAEATDAAHDPDRRAWHLGCGRSRTGRGRRRRARTIRRSGAGAGRSRRRRSLPAREPSS